MIYLLTCNGGEYEDVWEDKVAASHDITKVTKLKAKLEKDVEKRKEIEDILISSYEDIQEVHPKPEWDENNSELSYQVEDEWLAKYWHPLYLATLSAHGLTFEREPEWIPEGHELHKESVRFYIEGVEEI